ATMFNPPADMHTQFDAALAELNRSLGATHALYIDGEDRVSASHDTRRSPIDQRRILGHFPLATVDDANDAMVAAHAAFPSWRATPMAERVRLLKRVATLIEERVYHMAAAMARDVGENRMETLLKHANTAGITFTGSFDVGMHIYRSVANGRYPRPCITEMGGKNACVVTANADLECAAAGIVRSAYGLSGQKCSAVSRIYVDDEVADALIEKLQEKIAAVTIGDPSRQ